MKSLVLTLALYLTAAVAAPASSSYEPLPVTDYEILVIGAGPSGLQAGMSFGRLGRKAILFDSEEYRNAATLEMHDVPALDGTAPAVFRTKAREQLKEYPSVVYKRAKITHIQNMNNASYFVVQDSKGRKYSGRKVVLAAGVVDILPEIKGMDKVWGTGAFWCIFCDGYEHRDGPMGFLPLSTAGDSIGVTPLTKDITVFTNGQQLTPDVKAAAEKKTPYLFQLLAAIGAKLNTNSIASVSFVKPSDRAHSPVRISFLDRRQKDQIVKGLVVHTEKVPRTPDLISQLGLSYATPPTPGYSPLATRDVNGATDVYGVFVVGDLSSTKTNVPHAFFSAKAAAVQLVFQVATENAKAAAGIPWKLDW